MNYTPPHGTLGENIFLDDDGTLSMADGSSVQEYLRQFKECLATQHGEGKTPVTLMATKDMQRDMDDAILARAGGC